MSASSLERARVTRARERLAWHGESARWALGMPARVPRPPLPQARPIVVASKPFGESYLLAEMFAQLLEARGFQVDRRLGLGATEIAFRRFAPTPIDVYPEYTGTGLLAILDERPSPTRAQVYRAGRPRIPRRASVSAGFRRSGSRTPMPSPCAGRPPGVSACAR